MKNILKISCAVINGIISGNFKNSGLLYPNEKGALYVNFKAPHIRVGDRKEYKDFSDWVSAADYANNRNGEFYVGIRCYRHTKFSVVAIIKNV